MNVPYSMRSARGSSLVLLGSALLFAACSSASSNGSGGAQGSGGASSSSGGKTGSGGSGSGGNGSGGSLSGGSASGGSGSGGKVGSGGTSGSGGSGSGGTASGGTASGGVGSGGTSSSGGSGSGGSASGGASNGGGTGSGGAGGGSASGGTTGGGGGSGSSDCPTGAFFCSGFEDATLPSALVYKVNAAPGDWSRDFALDTTVHHTGKASLRVKSSSESGTSGSQYQMLAAPAAPAFWARFYIQSEMDIGGMDHNAFAEASGSDDPNDGFSVEFAEDVGIAFNTKDDDRWPTGYGRTMSGGTMPYSLSKNAWHCIELSFDSAGRVQQLFVEGMQLINATSYPSASGSFKVFKFGFMAYHGPSRKIWYDDVVVSPSRTPCP